MSQIAYSVCAPVFNEEDCLPALVEKIRPVMESVQKPWELILTDDGSSDRSWEIITELKKQFPFIHGLKFDRNHGQTAAMTAAIRAARGEFVITIDADLQNDPQDIPHLIEQLGPHEAAIGWRHNRQDTMVRRLSSRFANWFRNLVTNDGVQDTGCSLKLFRTEILRRLPMFEGMHRFLPALIKLEGGSVVEVKVGHHPRTRGTSKYNVWNRVFRSFLDLLAFAWMRWRHLHYKVSHEC